jgi:hypothetical protein
MSEVTLFAGPSAFGLPDDTWRRAGVRVVPPVRRGDVDKLVADARSPGVVIICDGLFHAAPAVSHAELCHAIDSGWEVWGVSSIGAIRAYEMRDQGMKGFGYVHSRFTALTDFADDEMCLLHFPEPPYCPLSEALVNVRYALDRQAAPLGISEVSQAALIAALRALYFGDRTEARIRGLMIADAGIEAAQADALLAWLKAHRIKSLDLVDLLAARPWAR